MKRSSSAFVAWSCCSFLQLFFTAVKNSRSRLSSSEGPCQDQDGEGHPGRRQPPVCGQAALRWVSLPPWAWKDGIHDCYCFKFQKMSSVMIAVPPLTQISLKCVFAAFQTEGKLYLILDFLRGGDLFTRLSKEVKEIHLVSVGVCWNKSVVAWSSSLPPPPTGDVYRGGCKVLSGRAGIGTGPPPQPGHHIQRPQTWEVWICRMSV